ncbi:hypothetical protein [Marinobacterium marinum]|uniref:Uncharacterized protein n=1 Tax=Marinobacterium marinum TaxID=2756129 RepID=A0A7W1WZN5_9GAMM|nr:hypothetical protein [Marinobacterium marinum]MBA4503184.1 hypothetical protein [Marinobacterium marinum]
MIRTKTVNVLLVLCMLLSPLSLTAATPDSLQVEAYIASLEDVRQLSEQLQASGAEALLAREVMPRAGEAFDPHRRAVIALEREHPDLYTQLIRIVRQRGFADTATWAAVGDRIVLAYGVIKAESESPEIFQLALEARGMNPQLLLFLPPAEQELVQQALLIAEALSQAPVSDREQVKPYIAQLDRAFSQ